jgi:hypothetical protein
VVPEATGKTVVDAEEGPGEDSSGNGDGSEAVDPS